MTLLLLTTTTTATTAACYQVRVFHQLQHATMFCQLRVLLLWYVMSLGTTAMACRATSSIGGVLSLKQLRGEDVNLFDRF